MTHFLVEMEPYGTLYISINYSRMSYASLYSYTEVYLKGVWYRYRLCVDGIEPEPFENIRWGYQEKYLWYIEATGKGIEQTMPSNHRGELDDSNILVTRTVSPYTLANVLEEKMYLFFNKYSRGYVPAVKIGDAYLNLVSMESFDSAETIKNMETPNIPLPMLSHKPEYKL